ncbi:MAG: hypothetical protein KIT07_10795 [Anaerolineales bacterium]|jgi:hypothetical protein|nr:hypothetical protein [Anaerolineales bacterium]MCW5888598.1 hypothetical protein [Anaerolineales bacterium]
MDTHLHSQELLDAAVQETTQNLATAVVRLADARGPRGDYRQRAQRSSLVNQALKAYRDYMRLSALGGAASTEAA